MQYETEDLRIRAVREVIPPVQLHTEIPMQQAAARIVAQTRDDVHRVLTGEDDRLVVVAGPCSIHDTDAALDYAGRLMEARRALEQQLLIVMRVYFEKPRTTVGWKGLINDPNLDDSFQINKGLRLARRLLMDLNLMGMPAGTEFLDPISPQYVADLVAWGAIGARTTESQVHRELASGLSCPVGFKNGTDGNLRIAVDAIRAARNPHHFLGVTQAGHSAIFATSGNDDAHLILRGGAQPNYDAGSVQVACEALQQAGLAPQVMIDLSHANSAKLPERQLDVAKDVGEQIAGGEARIFGVMVESHLLSGRQGVIPGRPLTYGQSITDACLGWEQTKGLLERLADSVGRRTAGAAKRASA
jgi:3-deoxy-7-phosphoheptulonate synthase